MSNLGIITAGGKGKRFGGIFKELLPVSDGETLLQRNVKLLEDIPVNHTLVVTSQYKLGMHALTLQGKNVQFIIQKDYEHDLWGALKESLPLAEDMNYFVMPDTYTPERKRIEIPKADFILGLFTTVHPHKFGVLWDGHIFDKSETFSNSIQIQLAWGFAGWSKRVAEFWQTKEITHYAEAFNMAMDEFGYQTFPLHYYYDISCMADYKRLLEHI